MNVKLEGSYMQLEPMGVSGISNVENSFNLDMREMITEYEMWGMYDYLKDVGSYLALIFLWVLVFFGLMGFVFIGSFVRQFKELIKRKYQEAFYLHQIRKHLKKFDQIHQALYDRKDEAEYKNIFKELDFFLGADYESMTYDEIEKLHGQM